ncbi:hypothetical protein [Acetobacter sp. UBA5411]|uniref:hypothetical protein n=1 Tax=Acetobacter sp. UBA5411 TaxID=1945905 RepID=UPI0025C28B8C|nr:hypothetical protein [Acetobacter sp. UBA5411]
MVVSGTCLHAQTITVPNGLPQGPIPTYEEVGLGGYTLPTSGGTRTIGGDGSTVSTTTTTSSGTDSDALEKMYSNSWGYQAGQNAEAVGVNPSALAATCIVESGCSNVYTAKGTNTITGAFQMSNSTYTAALNEALAAHPELASTIVSGTAGQQDPATQAIAAAQYLKDGATYLEKQGISSPTSVDTRAYYNFGPSTGANIARASDDTLMSTYLSAKTMSGNGVTSGETVGQWKAAVAAKMGSAAYQPVLAN